MTGGSEWLAKHSLTGHFHKWRCILLFLCIYVNYTYWPYFGLNIFLNFAHGSEARKAY